MSFFLRSESNDPYFNLALEEYWLNEREEELILIYENTSSVVIGKHQNVFRECRITRCEQNNIKIARRLSGGGTVFHGPGNINFCFIKNLEKDESMVDFQKHLQPIISFLNHLGLPAVFSGRNDILVDGFKVSGNAEHVLQKRKRLIHHGTLLFDADLKSLKHFTEEKSEVKFETHAVKSVRSQVGNISDMLSVKLSREAFTNQLSIYLKGFFRSEDFTFSNLSFDKIHKLVEDKQTRESWIFDYNPAFEMTTPDGWYFKVRKGIIVTCHKNGQTLESLIQKPFSKSILWEVLEVNWDLIW